MTGPPEAQARLDRPLRVLHVSQPAEGGLATCVLAITEHQRRLGWDVLVACPPAGSLHSWLAASGVPQAAWTARRQPGPSVAPEARALRKIVRDHRPDLVHLHSAKAGLVGRLVVRGRIPTIYEPHAWSFYAVGGLTGALALRWERAAARWTSMVLCVSNDEARTGTAHGIRAPSRVIPNGVDVRRFSPRTTEQRRSARTMLGVPVESRLAVCAARLVIQKGQDVLLRAWPAVRERVPGATLALLGDGPERRSLEGLAGPGVHFVGHVDDVRPWLQAADLLVLPSRWEGLSLTLLEAMASGLSVVSTEVDGARSLVLPDAGAVVPVEDPDALAAAVTARLADPVRAEREGAAGRRRVETTYDVEDHVRGVAELSLLVAGGDGAGTRD